MRASEHAEAAELVNGMVTVERYEVPVFVCHRRPTRGAGVRITTFEGDPADLNLTIGAFHDTAVPGLAKIPGLCGAQLMADRGSGRSARPSRGRWCAQPDRPPIDCMGQPS